MRINKYVAYTSSLSRRAADAAITDGRVTINNRVAQTGSQVQPTDTVCLDGTRLTPAATHTTIILNKPTGYVCSRNGQGSKTVFALLPSKYQHLQPVGRLDKDSSGLLLLTSDGDLANQLTHPRYAKTKVYEITLDKPLQPHHQQLITDRGIMLEDGLSRFTITRQDSKNMSHRHPTYEVRMQEGRNRQIRRSFAALGYTVTTLHRTHFGPYALKDLQIGAYCTVQV
ncbi:ribosomal large subunit pseudouridine synthase B [Candidatus Saccharibacteria bacterium]|nr:MAG: ribosomal large subunit pseudouridine synthase B [Candidatus Saccharibacteria bacterium]PID99538.1 MAG: ribosomal large subunit pseudouridine synthase B [Candidatus Saccharibacteria bacterium]